MKEDVVVAANYPLTEETLAASLTEAKCCLAKKADLQVQRLRNLKPESCDIQESMERLTMAIFIMEHHVVGTDNCLTDEQVYAITKISTGLCGCCND